MVTAGMVTAGMVVEVAATGAAAAVGRRAPAAGVRKGSTGARDGSAGALEGTDGDSVSWAGITAGTATGVGCSPATVPSPPGDAEVFMVSLPR